MRAALALLVLSLCGAAGVDGRDLHLVTRPPYYWLGTTQNGTCDRYRLTRESCVMNETVCPAGSPTGCEGEPNTWSVARTLPVPSTPSPPSPTPASARLALSYHRSCRYLLLEAEVDVDAPPVQLLLPSGEQAWVEAGTRFSTLLDELRDPYPRNYTVWAARADGTAWPLRVSPDRLCTPEPVFRLVWAEDDRIYMGVLWGMVLLCYYWGKASGYWAAHVRVGDMFHALLLHSHVALFVFITFTTFVAASSVALLLSLLGLGGTYGWKRLNGRRLTVGEVRGAEDMLVFQTIQFLFLGGLIAVGA